MEFRGFVDSLKFKSSNGPKNALEAIALALKSDWTTEGDKRRHIVFVFTNSPTLPLGVRISCPSYPHGMPADLKLLGEWWGGLDQSFNSTFLPRSSCLIAFVPNAEPWTTLQVWNRYWPVLFNTETGWEELDIQEAFDITFGDF